MLHFRPETIKLSIHNFFLPKLFTMPGTVQATVVEFKSGSSSSRISTAQSLKVSMGKKHFHTRDTGDFSFPITKLGDDLVVVLVDAGGNETARADIRLVQIIEKGYWDEVFSLDGGGADGQVHMKLQVILSEQERDRIRVMRDSAVKKKRETDPSNNRRLTESTSLTHDVVYSTSLAETVSDSQRKVAVSPKVNISQAGSLLNASTSPVKPLNNVRKDIGNAIPVKDFSVIQVKTESPRTFERIQDEKNKFRQPFTLLRSDILQGAVSMTSETTIPDKNSYVAQKSHDDIVHKSQDQSRTSSNVRKMISAFEQSQVQGTRRIRKSLSVPSNLYRAGKEGLLDVKDTEGGTEPAEQSLGNSKDRFVTGNLHQVTSTVTSRPDIVRSKTQQSQPPKESESNMEPNYISRAYPRERMAEESERSSDSLVSEGRETSVRSSCEGKISSETEMVEKHDSKQRPKHETEKNQKKLTNPPEPGSGSSPHESSNRLVGQIIKVVVILGFGLLVLLNRQKEPRKKRSFENIDLFTVPDYIEEGHQPTIYY